MVLFLIGLGLGDEKDITVKGLEAVKRCSKVYLEHYTSVLGVDRERLVAPPPPNDDYHDLLVVNALHRRRHSMKEKSSLLTEKLWNLRQRALLWNLPGQRTLDCLLWEIPLGNQFL